MTVPRSLIMLGACLAAAAMLTLPFLGARDLWAPDEPRYAQVAQEMLQDGQWWHPHVNARLYTDKPHLYFWLAALSGLTQGRVSESAARLPSALSHLALVAMTFLLGRRFFGDMAGLVAALALATTWLEAWMARRACLDVLLAACAMATILAMLRAGEAARAAPRWRFFAWSAAAGIACALGIMTKGPVVLLAIAGAGVPLLLSAGARADRPPGTAARGVAIAVFALAVVLAAWLLPAHVLGGYDPLAITQEQVLERAAEGRHHEQPPWYFLTSVPVDFLPWTLVMLPALPWAWKRRREPAMAMLLGWALIPLIAHSIIVEKRNIYVLPVLPAWALLGAGWLASMSAAPRGLRRALAIAAGVLGVVGLAALVARFVKLPVRATEAFGLPGVAAGVAVTGMAALAGASVLAMLLRKHASPLRLGVGLAIAFGITQLGIVALLPRLDSLKSGRAMGEFVRNEAKDAPVAMHPRTWDAYVYYSRRPITDMGSGAEAAAWLASVPRPAYVLAYEKDLGDLPLDGLRAPASVHSDDVGHRRVHLLRYDSLPETR